MNESIVAVTAAEARTAGERARDREVGEREVVLAVMRAARDGMMAPSEDEGFVAAVSALMHLFDGERHAVLEAEVAAIGHRNKLLGAVVSGVPVDWDAVEPMPMPEDAFGLIDLWNESAVAA